MGISALTGICRYSFSRIVTGSIKGERCGEGEAAAVAIHPYRKRADLALGVRLSLLASLPLQVSVVELQRLDNKIRFLPSGDGFRYELGYPFVLKGRLFFLVGLFLLHDALDNLVRELAVLHKLFHFDSLCK